MRANRLFWSQEVMDQLVVDEKAAINDDVLSIADDKLRYRVSQAVHFLADVGDGSDPHKLVGRVKDLEQLIEGGAEHYMDSVLIGDSAYQVALGFSGAPIVDVVGKAKGADISGAIVAAGGGEDGEDRELLAKFLLDNL